MQALGIFPSFQYSDDPSVNPLLNANVIYPPGMYQTTAQPAQPYYGSRGINGLGGFWSDIADHLSDAWDGFVDNASVLIPKDASHARHPMAPRAAGMRGLRGTSSIGSAISGIGTLIVLSLAGYGGYRLYKNHKTKG